MRILYHDIDTLRPDHGENLGELGPWSEHGSADAITCRIPMIIRRPGKTAGRGWAAPLLKKRHPEEFL